MAATARGGALHGRGIEVSELDAVLDRAVSGRLAVVLVEGEAGIGKTRLLAEALARARARGCDIASGRAEELERTRPFGIIADALGCVRSASDPRRAAIAALLATHDGGERGPITVSSDPGLQFRAVDAFTDLAEELALDRALVIALDDLQWADPSSLLTISALGRHLADLPVALIGCFRPFRRAPTLQRVLDSLESGGARRLTLRPLTERAVYDLVAESVAAKPGPGLLAGLAGAAGNPLFVTEVLGAIMQEGTLRSAAGILDVAEVALPPTLRLTILRRLSFLPDDTLQALRSASILGSSFSLTELSTITDRSAVELSSALAEALGALVLEDDGAHLRFRHDLIRDAVYDDLPASVRLGLHREAGQRLANTGAPALRVAEQLARGATPGDADAISWLTRAARETAPRSPITGADLLERAIVLMQETDPCRDQVLAERAQSLMLAGRIADAEAACRSLLARDHDPDSDGPARICLSGVLLAQGRISEGVLELETAVGSPALSRAQRAAARGLAGLAQVARGELAKAVAAAEQARSGAAAAADHVTTSVALEALARASQLRGRLHDALRVIDDAVRLADTSPGRVGHRYPVHVTRADILIGLDQLEPARASLQAGRRISEELGGWPVVPYQAYSALERFTAGQWDDAVTELEASIGLAEETGVTYGQVLCHNLLSLIRLHRNDLPAARLDAAAAGRQANAGPGHRTYETGWVRALLLEADGAHAEALATLTEVWDQCIGSGIVIDCPVLGPDLVRLALAAGDEQRAREVAVAVEAVASANQVPSLTGAALRCRGLAQDDAEILGDAVAAYASGPRPLELALACQDAGTAHGRRGHVDAARRLLDQAASLFERLDAARDLARTDAAMRELGVRRGRRGPRRRPRTGWPSLTSTERTVAELVAEGLSNPQIGNRLYISRRTVQTHLAHIFAKLDITSRAQLAAEVTRHQD